MSRHEGKLTLSISSTDSGIADLERLPARLDRAMLQGTIDAADELFDGIVAGIPRSEGDGPHAQDSWRRRIIPYANGALVILFTESEVAYYYWSGTKAHPIVARFAKALRFYWQGRLWYRKSVQHPGTRPHPYVEDAGRDRAHAMRESYDDAVSRVLSATGGV